MLLIDRTLEAEQKELSENVKDKIINLAEGSGRKIMVLLGQVIDQKTEEEQLNSLVPADTQREAFDLVKMLAWENPTWQQVSAFLKTYEKEPEELRRLVLSVATSSLLKGGKNCDRYYVIINSFRDNFFDSGKAGLAAACYEVITGK